MLLCLARQPIEVDCVSDEVPGNILRGDLASEPSSPRGSIATCACLFQEDSDGLRHGALRIVGSANDLSS
jgi:hypothetical protein